MKFFIKIILLSFCIYCSSEAGDKTRRYTNSFLEIPLGARAGSLGGAFSGVANDGTAFFWNPAGISLVARRAVSLSYINQFGGMAQYNFLGYNHQLNNTYSFSVGFIRYSIDNIPENSALSGSIGDHGDPDYDFGQYEHGHFSYSDNAIYISFARMNTIKLNLGWAYNELPIQIPVGLNLKILNGGTSGISGANGVISNNAKKSGIGIDLGTMIMFGMSDFFEKPGLGDFTASFNFQDITKTGAKYNRLSSNVKAQDITKPNFKFGISYIQGFPQYDFNLLTSYESNSRYKSDRHYGIELEYLKTASLRFGLDNKLPTYGAGFNYNQIQFDYAINNHALGITHRISLSYTF